MLKHKNEHSHHHHDITDLSSSRLLGSFLVNFIIAISEVIGGMVSGSLSLISDSLHNLSDSFAILIAYFANKISKKPNNFKYTFGYRRAEILAALINSISLFAISLFLFREAYLRIVNPVMIKTDIAIVIAIIGLMANIIGVILLSKDRKKNLNIKAAYLHLIVDSLSSVTVIIGLILIKLYNITIIDPILTFIIAIFVLKESYKILKRTVEILLMAAPDNISIEEIKRELEKFDPISNVHHVHLWNIDDKQVHFEAHVELPMDMKISETDNILCNIEQLLHEKFGIDHVTIQFETNKCEDKNILKKV